MKPDDEDYPFTMLLGFFTAKLQIKTRELTIDEINKGISIFDALTKEEKTSIDDGMASMHEVLASNDFKASIEKMGKYLEDL